MTINQQGSMSTSTAATPPTILCVDDEPNILSSLRRLFRPHGYRVLTADGGAAGLALLESETVDLVISDMHMVHINGAQFLAQVRQRWPGIMRLLLTGYADIQSILDAVNHGEIYRYLTKPWNENDIVLVVRHALERRAQEQEKLRMETLTAGQNMELQALNACLEAKISMRILSLASDYNGLQIGAMGERRLHADEVSPPMYNSVGNGYNPAVAATLRPIIDETDSPARDLTVLSRQLEPGMVLSRDLISRDGLMLLAANHVLTPRLIAHLLDFEGRNGGRLTIRVSTPPKEG
ncbi:response regulator [Janthinobacterium sp. Ant5-2-1]|uniref:response regulator n=1 Tax=Janthinobacterium sp. Ant5-2-1 TaxID=1755239 RepID=UPI0007180328|nr:response regulator [Janthinobacterium sp. Ant5-2-1]